MQCYGEMCEPGVVSTNLQDEAYEDKYYKKRLEGEVERTSPGPTVAESHEMAHVITFL